MYVVCMCIHIHLHAYIYISTHPYICMYTLAQVVGAAQTVGGSFNCCLGSNGIVLQVV